MSDINKSSTKLTTQLLHQIQEASERFRDTKACVCEKHDRIVCVLQREMGILSRKKHGPGSLQVRVTMRLPPQSRFAVILITWDDTPPKLSPHVVLDPWLIGRLIAMVLTLMVVLLMKGIGSLDATTCHIVGLRDPETQAVGPRPVSGLVFLNLDSHSFQVCLAHLDSDSHCANHITQMVDQLKEITGSGCSSLETFICGGFVVSISRASPLQPLSLSHRRDA